MASFPSPSERLAAFFSECDPSLGQQRKPYTDVEIQHIASLLRRIQHSWSKAPRTYIVLRTISRLDLLNDFIELGFTDHWFPVQARSLPNNLSPSVVKQFLGAQRLILTKSIDLEKGEQGEHCNFARGEPLPFTIEAKLGSGGFSQVDKVLSLVSYKQYALKRIRRRIVFSDRSIEDMKRFVDEVQIIKRLKHWHIVEFVGSYSDPSFLGLLISPVADRDLAKLLDSMPANQSHTEVQQEVVVDLRTYFGCLAMALRYLHDESIRHKDIKPQNILIEKRNVLLTDFGLSLDFSDASGSTTSGATAKTPRYCAPEVAAWNSRNTSSDIWSLGCVFLEIIAVLKGYTTMFVKEYFEKNGSREPYYHSNSEATSQILDLFEHSGCLTDSKPIGWVREMLNRDRDGRPTAAQLVNMVITPDLYDTMAATFCGICCLGDEDYYSCSSVREEETTAASSKLQNSQTIISSGRGISLGADTSAQETASGDNGQVNGVNEYAKRLTPIFGEHFDKDGTSVAAVQLAPAVHLSTSESQHEVRTRRAESSEDTVNTPTHETAADEILQHSVPVDVGIPTGTGNAVSPTHSLENPSLEMIRTGIDRKASSLASGTVKLPSDYAVQVDKARSSESLADTKPEKRPSVMQRPLSFESSASETLHVVPDDTIESSSNTERNHRPSAMRSSSTAHQHDEDTTSTPTAPPSTRILSPPLQLSSPKGMMAEQEKAVVRSSNFAPLGSKQRTSERRDLKSWWKAFKKVPKQRTETDSPIFGVAFTTSLRYANVAISLLDPEGKSYVYGYVPIVVAKVGVFLKEKATDVEYIFATPGDENRVAELKLAFNSPVRYGKGLSWIGYTVHDAAGVLLQYLEELPVSIVPNGDLHKWTNLLRGHQFEAVGASDYQLPSVGLFNLSLTIKSYQGLVTELQPLHRHLLLYLLDLLAGFDSKSNLNKMTTPQIANVFYVSVFGLTSSTLSAHELRLAQDVMIFLIKNQDDFLIGSIRTDADEKMVDDVQRTMSVRGGMTG